jgi:hypothetical protein
MAGVLQHLRSSTLNKRPNPASMVDGQLAINYASGSPGAFFKDSNGNLVKVGPAHVGATAPNVSPASGGTAGNSLGEQWLDTSGGTYVFKIWDGAAWRSEAGEFVNVTGDTMTGALGVIVGSASTPGLFFSGDANSGLYSPGADQVAISTGGSGRLFVDASGRVGVGTSPSYALHVSGTGTVSSRTLATDATGDASFFVQNDGNGICGPLVYGSTKTAYGALASNETAFYSNRSTTIMADGGSAVIKFATGGNTERARIDSSGRLLVGTSSASGSGGAKLEVAKQTMTTSDMGLASFQLASASSRWPQVFLEKSRGAAVGQKTLVVDGDSLGELAFRGADGTNYLTGANIVATVDGVASTNDLPTRLVFSTTADGAASPTERMRITQTGEIYVFCASGAWNHTANNGSGAGTVSALYQGRYGATDNTGTTGTQSYVVWTNGNVQNTNNSYTAISDIKLKENIVDAGSQWADLKALRVRNYNLKEGQTHRQIGLIAQEVEPISPGLVYESPDRDAEGNDLGTVTKSVNYSVLYMKAVKALQEAMERIEVLEQRLADAGIA